MMPTHGGRRSHLMALLTSGALLGVGLIDLPTGPLRTTMQSIKSTEANADGREAAAGGYYEDLLNGGATPDGSRDEISLRLLGKPDKWINFHDTHAALYFPDRFLQFELRPGIRHPILDHEFTTNSLGLRDREGYTVEKPPGVVRIAVLGSSIDMGWGVRTEESYENQLEDWLNHQAQVRKLDRKFEVLNFACAAYSPAQRLESYRTKAAQYQPDLVLYSATMLDPRLSQIHLCDVLRGGADPGYDFVRRAIEQAGVTEAERALDERGDLRHKSAVKAKLQGVLWSLGDGALEELAAACRSDGARVVCLIVPRASLSDTPEGRAEGVARHRAIAARQAVHVIDLTPAFDEEDIHEVELAPWDDHPNARGHRLMFFALAEALLDDPRLESFLFRE
jgi:hypothetical protein